MFLIQSMLKILNEQIQKDIKFQQSLKIYLNPTLDLNNINRIILKLNSLTPSLEKNDIDNSSINNKQVSKNFPLKEQDIDEDSWDVISDNINKLDNSLNINDSNNAFENDYNTSSNIDSNNNVNINSDINSDYIDNDFADEFEEINTLQISDQEVNEAITNMQESNEDVLVPEVNEISEKKGENLLDFYEQKSFINDISKYIDTPYVHKYEFDGTQSENDKYIENHYAFISDFYPVNNNEVLSLLKTVRESLKNNIHTSAIDIYKHWLRYLKSYNQDYHLYDYRNFNDQGEFVGRVDQQVNDSVLDNYLEQNESALTYDEAKAKREQKEKDKIEALNILKSGTYESEIDPDLGSMFIDK